MNDKDKAVTDAIRDGEDRGEVITVSTIARASGVDRTYIYRHPALLAAIKASGVKDGDWRRKKPSYQLSETELAAVREAAEKAGLPLGAYSRNAVLAQVAKDLGLDLDDLGAPRRQAPRGRNRGKQREEGQQ